MQRFLVFWYAVLALGCEGNDARIYTARPYRAPEQMQAGCVEGSVPLAVVYAGSLRAQCEPVCLRLNEQLYVSIVCPPYPEQAQLETAETSPECAGALAALAAEQTCAAELPDGPAAGSMSRDE
jgi:hypothetical protein